MLDDQKYDDILNGKYNELFISFAPVLTEKEKGDIDNILINKQECIPTCEWFETDVNNSYKKASGKSYQIKPELSNPCKLYANIIYKYLKNKNKMNSLFTVSDWRKYINKETEEDQVRDMINSIKTPKV